MRERSIIVAGDVIPEERRIRLEISALALQGGISDP